MDKIGEEMKKNEIKKLVLSAHVMFSMCLKKDSPWDVYGISEGKKRNKKEGR